MLDRSLELRRSANLPWQSIDDLSSLDGNSQHYYRALKVSLWKHINKSYFYTLPEGINRE
jgi:hypothetical protein